jgi:hypothetical protein
VQLDSLAEEPATLMPRSSVDLAYRNDLFAVSFSRSFYEGYVATSALPAVRFTGKPYRPTGSSHLAGLEFDAAYLLSPAVFDLGGAMHGVSIGLRRPL